jgi:hypothetical protein
MSLRVFDTQFGAQGMEIIGANLVLSGPFLAAGWSTGCIGPRSFQRVVLFFNGIPEGIPCRGNHKYC